MPANLPAQDTVTVLLCTSDAEDGTVVDRLLPLVYDELRLMAHRHLSREREGHTLNTTALVHEAYLKLVDQTQVTARGRTYFFGAAARSMRQILIEHARRRSRLKRGGTQRPITLSDSLPGVDAFAADLIDLDNALNQMAARYPRQAQMVECRFLGG